MASWYIYNTDPFSCQLHAQWKTSKINDDRSPINHSIVFFIFIMPTRRRIIVVKSQNRPFDSVYGVRQDRTLLCAGVSLKRNILWSRINERDNTVFC